MNFNITCFCVVIFFSFLSYVGADTPANCSYSDAEGIWQFSVAPYESNCTTAQPFNILFMHLKYPNIVTDEFGNVGRWTLIYNQGFEVNIANRKWLVKFDYDRVTNESYCNKGIPEYTHDVLIRQWACFTASKVSANKVSMNKQQRTFKIGLNKLYQKNINFVDKINAVQSSWKAVHYAEHEKYTLLDMQRRAGGKKSILYNKPLPAPITEEMRRLKMSLPKEFDWRKNSSDGRSAAVTPVRDQRECGSCYAFASAAALEARIRIATKGAHAHIISPQDILDCSTYSEGCDGGFPYLIAGKYAEDFGLVPEKCNPYTGRQNLHCTTMHGCQRFYATNYHYIGGYYGACNEVLMMQELVANGPFPVGFEVYSDFANYRSGVYSHTKLTDNLNKFNPFEITNHAVTLVGYGVEEATDTPFWIIKNSWGKKWGEDGYFRIRRGNNECGIESIGVSFEPVI